MAAVWEQVGAVETVEEKTESFDILNPSTQKVISIQRITSRRKIKITD